MLCMLSPVAAVAFAVLQGCPPEVMLKKMDSRTTLSAVEYTTEVSLRDLFAITRGLRGRFPPSPFQPSL